MYVRLFIHLFVFHFSISFLLCESMEEQKRMRKKKKHTHKLLDKLFFIKMVARFLLHLLFFCNAHKYKHMANGKIARYFVIFIENAVYIFFCLQPICTAYRTIKLYISCCLYSHYFLYVKQFYERDAFGILCLNSSKKKMFLISENKIARITKRKCTKTNKCLIFNKYESC